MKAKTQNLKWNLFRCNSKAFELLFTYIHHALASLSVLFKHKSLSFVNLSLFLHHVSTFWLEHLYILLKLQRPAFKVHVLWCKTDIYSWNFSEKVSLMYEDLFPILLLCNLKYINLYFILNIIWEVPESSWSPSELDMFLKIDPQCFGPFDKFQDAKEISMKTACVSKLSFRLLWLQ